MFRTVLRYAALLFWLALAVLISWPFVMTSRALHDKGIVIPAKIYHKSEYVSFRESGWELKRDLTFQYTVPETRGTSFLTIHPDAQTYDAIRTGQAVRVRYLQRQDLPDVPGAKLLWELHASTAAEPIDVQGISRMAPLLTPGAIRVYQVLGGIVVMLVCWKVTGIKGYAWAAGAGGALLVGLLLYGDFPRRTPAPAVGVKSASARVVSLSELDRIFSGRRTRGFDAEQPVDVVGVEFVPEGRSEPVVAVDLIDQGSLPGLQEKAEVMVKYEAATPRVAYIDGATRHFPERNFNGLIIDIAIYIGVLVLIYWVCTAIARAFRRFTTRLVRR